MNKKIGPRGKLLNKFRDFSKSKAFREDIAEARKRFGIPLEGYKNKEVGNVPVETDMDLFFWTHEFLHKNAIPFNDYIVELVSHYVLYDELYYRELWNEEYAFDMCLVSTAEEQIDWLDNLSDTFLSPYVSKEVLNEYREKLIEGSLAHPTFIRIREHATIEDVKGFVGASGRFREVLGRDIDFGSRYSLKNAKAVLRTNIAERDDFISKHLDVPNKELLVMLREELGDSSLDEGSIGKIKSQQRKLRD